MMPQGPQKRPAQDQQQPLAQPQQDSRSVDSAGGGRQGPAWGAPQPPKPTPEAVGAQPGGNGSTTLGAQQQYGKSSLPMQNSPQPSPNGIPGGSGAMTLPPRNYYGEQPQSNSRMGPQVPEGPVGTRQNGIPGGSGSTTLQGQSAPHAWGPSITSSLPMSGMPSQAWGPSTSDALSQIGKGVQPEQPGAPQMDAGGSYMGPLQDAAKVPEATQPIETGQSSIAPGAQLQRQQRRRMQQRGYYGE